MAEVVYENLGSNKHKITYNEDGSYFVMEQLQRDSLNKTTQIKYSNFVAEGDSIENWTSPEWVTDATLAASVENPIGDLIIWLLRLIGKRFNRPFGAI
jgi:hypothetical protein